MAAHHSSSPTSPTSIGVDAPSSRVAAVYGGLILDRLCTSPFITPRDLIPLRGVAKQYRDLIDTKFVAHVSIIELPNKTRILSAHDGKGIPGFVSSHAHETKKRKIHTRSKTHLDSSMDRLKGTAVVDITNVPRRDLVHLKEFLKNVHTIRLMSDLLGLHTYSPPPIGRADSTMVVFPSFMPVLPSYVRPERCTVPNNITTLVQHLSRAADFGSEGGGRGPVLFKAPGTNVKNEVWVFTHLALKIDPGRVGLYDDRVFDAEDDVMEELVEATRARLNSTNIELIFVDGDETFMNLCEAYKAYDLLEDFTGVTPTRLNVEDGLTTFLGENGVQNLDRLHFMTWNEYAATLSPEQKELQTLPDDYIQNMEMIPDMRLPKICDSCYTIYCDDQINCMRVASSSPP